MRTPHCLVLAGETLAPAPTGVNTSCVESMLLQVHFHFELLIWHGCRQPVAVACLNNVCGSCLTASFDQLELWRRRRKGARRVNRPTVTFISNG